MIKDKLASILRNLRQPENLMNLGTVLVALFLGYRSIKTGATEQFFQAVLLVLGVLALAQLVAGYTATQRDARMARLAEIVLPVTILRAAVWSGEVWILCRHSVYSSLMETS